MSEYYDLYQSFSPCIGDSMRILSVGRIRVGFGPRMADSRLVAFDHGSPLRELGTMTCGQSADCPFARMRNFIMRVDERTSMEMPLFCFYGFFEKNEICIIIRTVLICRCKEIFHRLHSEIM